MRDRSRRIIMQLLFYCIESWPLFNRCFSTRPYLRSMYRVYSSAAIISDSDIVDGHEGHHVRRTQYSSTGTK